MLEAATKLKNSTASLSKLKVRLLEAGNAHGRGAAYLSFFDQHCKGKDVVLQGMIAKYEQIIQTRALPDGHPSDLGKITAMSKADSAIVSPIMSALSVLRTLE